MKQKYKGSGKVVLVHLTKHYMKLYPVLNKASHREDSWRSGGIAPRILNFGTRWR